MSDNINNLDNSVICFLLGNSPASWVLKADVSKLRCIQITSTEMGDSTSANPGSHCCINPRKRDKPKKKRQPPSITQWSPRTELIYTTSPLHYLLCIHPHRLVPPLPMGPATTILDINTPHIPAPVILHPPAIEDRTDRGFRNVGF